MAEKRGVGETGLPSSYTARTVSKQVKTVAKLKRRTSDAKYDVKRPPVAARVEPEIRKQLEAIAETMGVPLSSVVEQALVYFCREHDAGRIQRDVQEEYTIEKVIGFSRIES